MIAAEIVEMFEELSTADWPTWQRAFAHAADLARELRQERVRLDPSSARRRQARHRSKRTAEQRAKVRDYMRIYMRQYRREAKERSRAA